MYFKTFTISLIFCFLIANPVLGEPTEDEILETSFNDCRKWLMKPSESIITLSEFISYAGNYNQTVNSTLSYLKDSQVDVENQNKIHLGLYKELIKAICKVNGLPLEFFTRIRKEASDEKILETSFDSCREWLKKPLAATITLSEFLSYVDDGSGSRKIEESTILYLSKIQTDGADEYRVDFWLYKELVKEISKINGLPIAYFARIKKKTSNDKILEKSFENCREWLKKPSEPIITLSEFLSYVDECPGCRNTVVSTIQYLKETQPGDINENSIDLSLYKQLMKSICKVNGLPLDYFAKVITDLFDDKIVEKSFDHCRKWLKKPSTSTITLTEFLSYAGNYAQTRNSTLSYLKDPQTGAINKRKIDLGLYKELVREICKVNGLSLKIFTSIRKAASGVKKWQQVAAQYPE